MSRVIKAVICLIAAVVFVSAEECAEPYSQCAGLTHTGPYCCVVGYQCHKVDSYYSQCVPVQDDSCTNQLYTQCGGASFTGPTCCPVGSICKFHDTYYSQCRPIVEPRNVNEDNKLQHAEEEIEGDEEETGADGQRTHQRQQVKRIRNDPVLRSLLERADREEKKHRGEVDYDSKADDDNASKESGHPNPIGHAVKTLHHLHGAAVPETEQRRDTEKKAAQERKELRDLEKGTFIDHVETGESHKQHEEEDEDAKIFAGFKKDPALFQLDEKDEKRVAIQPRPVQPASNMPEQHRHETLLKQDTKPQGELKNKPEQPIPKMPEVPKLPQAELKAQEPRQPVAHQPAPPKVAEVPKPQQATLKAQEPRQSVTHQPAQPKVAEAPKEVKPVQSSHGDAKLAPTTSLKQDTKPQGELKNKPEQPITKMPEVPKPPQATLKAQEPRQPFTHQSAQPKVVEAPKEVKPVQSSHGDAKLAPSTQNQPELKLSEPSNQPKPIEQQQQQQVAANVAAVKRANLQQQIQQQQRLGASPSVLSPQEKIMNQQQAILQRKQQAQAAAQLNQQAKSQKM